MAAEYRITREEFFIIMAKRAASATGWSEACSEWLEQAKSVDISELNSAERATYGLWLAKLGERLAHSTGGDI